MNGVMLLRILDMSLTESCKSCWEEGDVQIAKMKAKTSTVLVGLIGPSTKEEKDEADYAHRTPCRTCFLLAHSLSNCHHSFYMMHGWKTRTYVSNRCSSTGSNFVFWFCWEHCDAPAWIGFGRRATSCSAGFTTVLQERGASADRSKVHHSVRENLKSSPSQDPTSTGKLVALFSSKNRSNQEKTFPHNVFFGSEPFFDSWKEITCLLKRDLNSWSRNIKWSLLTLALVNFSGKLVLSGWNWRMAISDMKDLEESNSVYRKNWALERKHFEKLRLEAFTKWENWRELRNLRVHELSVCKLRERVSCHNTGAHFTDTWIEG